MAEAVPHGDALVDRRVARDDDLVGEQHAVERMGGGNQCVAIVGVDQLLDQRVDAGVLDARIVVRAGSIGGGRAPEIELLVAR